MWGKADFMTLKELQKLDSDSSAYESDKFESIISKMMTGLS
jgi:hypothetical protein